MKILTPTPITDTEFVACSVPETDHPEWSAATAYVVGDKAMIAATHKTYEALTGHTNKPPATNPSDWLDLGPTNRWRMFDQKVGTVTSATGEVSVEIAPGIVNALTLVGVVANTVQVIVTDPVEGVVYDQTRSLYDPLGVTDWWEYFFEPVRTKTTLVIDDLPSYGGATIEVIATGDPAATVKIGALVVGRLREYARAVNAGAGIGIQDYSRKDQDEFGNYYIVERHFAKRARWEFVLRNADVDVLQAQLGVLRATPAIYIGGGNFEATTLYGFCRNFEVVISYPQHSICSMDIEGLV